MTSKTITDLAGDTLRLSTGSLTAGPGEVTVKVTERFRGREAVAAVHVDPAELRAALDEVAPAGSYTRTDEAPTITLYRVPDPNHVRVKVEHPAFGVFGEVVHLPNTPATVADDLWVSFSSEEVLIEHPLIGRHARALDIPVSAEMVERAQGRGRELLGVVWDHEVVEAMIVAALTEPPARPEGAEEIEAYMREIVASHPEDHYGELADHLASRGVLPPITDKTNPEKEQS